MNFITFIIWCIGIMLWACISFADGHIAVGICQLLFIIIWSLDKYSFNIKKRTDVK